MKITQRLIRSIKEDGILNTIKKFFKKIKNRIQRYEIKNRKINLSKKLNLQNYKRIIIFENQFGWNKIMKQRPQQMASATDDSTLFLYGTTYMEIGDTQGIKQINKNLYLIDLVIYKEELIKITREIKNKYIMIYSTDYIPMDVLKPYLNNDFKIIYEFVDGIDEKLCGKETAKLLLDRHKTIINDYNPYIIATSTKLYDSIKKENNNVKLKLVTNGVDYDYFANPQVEMPKEMEKIKKDGNIIIGYYGALASWFDYNLVEKLAKQNTKYQIVLIGLNYDQTLDKSEILKIPNIHYLGKKKYEELAEYLHAFDICILPFLINEITLSTSPVKIFEYMAARKPIVTTDLPECRKYDSILLGKNNDDFIKKTELAISKINDEQYLNLLTKEAKENDWRSKFNSLLELIENGEKNEG